MENFLTSLIYGISEIPKNKKEIFNRLEKLGAITTDNKNSFDTKISDKIAPNKTLNNLDSTLQNLKDSTLNPDSALINSTFSDSTLLDSVLTPNTKKKFYLKKDYFIGYVDIVKLDSTCSQRNTNRARKHKKDKSRKSEKIYFLKTLNYMWQEPKIVQDSTLFSKLALSCNDLVLAKLIKPNKKRDKANYRLKVKVLEVLSYRNLKCNGILKKVKNEYKIFDLTTFKQINLKLSQKSLKVMPLNCIFEIDLRAKKIIKVLGVIENAKVDLELTLNQFERESEFPLSVNAFERIFDFEIEQESYPNRFDLSNLDFVTIDPEDAKDFDDAIYFDCEFLFVAIADVSHYVLPNTSLDKEALKRGFSIYFPNISIPMLPSFLSQNLCSLKAGKKRLAFVWKLKIDKKSFEVVESSLFEAIIKVRQNFSYKQIDDFLNTKLKLEKKFNFIKKLYALTSQIRKIRLKTALDFISDKVKLMLNQFDEIEKIEQIRELKSNHLIEECMLLANKESAKLMQDYGGIFRVHNEISKENLKTIFSNFNFIKFDKSKSIYQNISTFQDYIKMYFPLIIAKALDVDIISHLPKAIYAPQNSIHFALGFESYCHFTSPIRRYSDLFTHRILKEILNNKKLDFLLSQTNMICDKLNRAQNEINKIELNFKDRKFARYFAKNIGMIIECCASEKRIAKYFGTRILLDRDVREFSQIRAKIISSNIETLEIKAEVLEIIENDGFYI